MGLGDILADEFGADLSNPATAATLAQYGITKLPYPTFDADNGAINNTSVATGLTRFPQYSGVQNDSPGLGNSTYHALQLTARKNSTHGLTFIAAYTLSKNISDSASAMRYYNVYIQDLYNRKLEKSIVSFDYPQVLKLTWIYALPFGHGQRWMHSSGLADRIFSGWQLTAIQRYGSGTPWPLARPCTATSPRRSGRTSFPASPKPSRPIGLNALLAYDPNTGAVTNGTALLNPAAFVNPPTSPNMAPRCGRERPRRSCRISADLVTKRRTSVSSRTRKLPNGLSSSSARTSRTSLTARDSATRIRTWATDFRPREAPLA